MWNSKINWTQVGKENKFIQDLKLKIKSFLLFLLWKVGNLDCALKVTIMITEKRKKRLKT